MLFCLFARFPITRGHAQTAKGHPTITANETAAFGERNATAAVANTAVATAAVATGKAPLHTLMYPSESSMRFSGFKSRYTYPFSCNASNASTTCPCNVQRATCELVDATVFNCAVSCDCGFERLSVRLTTKPVNQCRLTEWLGATMSSQTALPNLALGRKLPLVCHRGSDSQRHSAVPPHSQRDRCDRPRWYQLQSVHIWLITDRRGHCVDLAPTETCAHSAIARFVHTSSGVQRSAEHATDAAQRTAGRRLFCAD